MQIKCISIFKQLEADPLKSDLKKNKKGLASVILAAKPISRFGTCYNTYK